MDADELAHADHGPDPSQQAPTGVVVAVGVEELDLPVVFEHRQRRLNLLDSAFQRQHVGDGPAGQ